MPRALWGNGIAYVGGRPSADQALSVIGAGFGRTGTYSLNLALETIGFGPCHHMADMIQSERQREGFRAAGRGEAPDWDTLYDGYRSGVDWPTAFFWSELAKYFPDAKVVLTTRTPKLGTRVIGRPSFTHNGR